MTRHTPRRFDMIELILCCTVVAVAAGVLSRQITRPPPPAVPAFAASFGPKVSEHNEEWIVRDYFKDERGGIFVDVGAADYKALSNTYRLEHDFGWSGVAIDPQTQYAEGYRLHRPQTRFVAAFASDTRGTAAFGVPTHAEDVQNASGDLAFVSALDKNYPARGQTPVIQVPSDTLTAILDAAGIARVDFLSMDIERWEPKALAGFDVDRFRPRLACIEAYEPVRQQILDYFHSHGYVLIGKYLRDDDENLWFMPATTR